MNVLVTGGAGYIGSHTAKALAQAGHLPVTLDNLSTGYKPAVRWGPLVQGDLADRSFVLSVLLSYNIEGVVHFAASAYVGESMQNPSNYFHNNVTNSLFLLDAMLAAEVKRIVFSSSCATYGIPDKLPISEESLQRPISPYGESKLFIERALHWYGEAHGLQWTALRYFNAAGADLDGEIGENHEPETHLIPLAIHTALGRRPFLRLFGADYPTSDGTAVRDYVHVWDLATAHVRAIEYLANGGNSIAVNLSAARGYSVREIVSTVEAVSGRRIPTVESPRRPGDPAVLCGCSDLAKKRLGWSPDHSDLETMIRSAWNWQLVTDRSKNV